MQPCEASKSIYIPILQMRQLRLREAKELAQSHTANE